MNYSWQISDLLFLWQTATPSKIPSILNNIVGRKFKFFLKINKNNTSGGRKEGFKVIKLQEIKGELIKGNADAPDKDKEINKETRTCKRKQPNLLNQREDRKIMKITYMDEDNYENLYDNDNPVPKPDKKKVQNTLNTNSNNKKLQAATVTKMLGKTSKTQPQAQVDNNIQNSAARDDTLKKKKRLCNKKNPPDLSNEQEKIQGKCFVSLNNPIKIVLIFTLKLLTTKLFYIHL